MKVMKNKNILIAVIVAVIIAAAIFIVIITVNNINNKNNKNQNEEMNSEVSGSITESSDINNKNKSEIQIENKTISVIIPPDKPAYYDALTNALRNNLGAGAGIEVKEIAWADIGLINAKNDDVVILPEAETVPYGASQAIDTYLKNGGKLVTLGGPPFSKTLYPSGGSWLTKEDLISQNTDRQMLFDFEKATDNKGWNRSSDTMNNKQLVEVGDFGSPDGNCLHVVSDNVVNWDVISKSVRVPAGSNTIGLYAKGGPNTSFLSIELDEKDQSRWYAVFPVTQEWQYIALTADDFTYWADNASVGRGGAGDKVSIENVNKFAVGFAFSGIKTGPNEFWIDSVSAFKSADFTESVLTIEGLSPEWKFYPITNGNKAAAFDNQIFVADRDYKLPDKVFSVSPRPQGTGYNKGREFRFVPLIEVYDSKNLRSGFLAWMFINNNSSITAGFGTSDPEFYNNGGIDAVTDVVKTILEDNMFIEAGATEYLYIDSETKSLPVGAKIRGKNADGLTMEIKLLKDGNQVYYNEYDISNVNGTALGNGVKTFDWSENINLDVLNITEGYLPEVKPDYITVTLKKDGQIIDKISHEIVFWSPKPESERRYITIENNEFMRDGKPLRLYGVNFMPSSGIAVNLEQQNYFEQYVSLESYDPDVFYKDLLRVKDIGFNAVSVFVYHDTAMDTNNMLHLIDMCDKLGLVVDLSIRPYADPFNLNDGEVIDMIKALHSSELDNIVAYDVAWERYFGTYDGSYGNGKGRKEYDSDWREWINNNYGSIENAEKEWGCQAVKTGGEAVSPTDDMLRNDDAKYNKMVAAYRRFVDDLVSKKHNYVKDLISEYDPNHFVSARLGSQGGVPLADPGDMGYDFQALATAFDFMSPECYAINTATTDQIIFTNIYSRYTLPGAPIMWKEFGYSVWSGSNFSDKTQVMQTQADYYSKLLDAMIYGHTGASFCWFYAGGYRTNERSDFGIINPDGSDRPVTQVLREYKDKFLNQPVLGEPDVFFDVDRDRSVTGIKNMYESIQNDLISAVKSGKTVAFKDESAGTNTATVPDTAIGGGTAGPENPSKYVNGDFRAIYVKLSDGSWKRVSYGGLVSLPAGPIEIKAVMGNALRPEWLSKSASDKAYVSLVSTPKSGIAFNIPLSENVKYLGILTQEFTLANNFTGRTDICFRFNIEGRFPFGDSFKFTVTPK